MSDQAYMSERKLAPPGMRDEVELRWPAAHVTSDNPAGQHVPTVVDVTCNLTTTKARVWAAACWLAPRFAVYCLVTGAASIVFIITATVWAFANLLHTIFSL